MIKDDFVIEVYEDAGKRVKSFYFKQGNNNCGKDEPPYSGACYTTLEISCMIHMFLAKHERKKSWIVNPFAQSMSSKTEAKTYAVFLIRGSSASSWCPRINPCSDLCNVAITQLAAIVWHANES